MSSFIVLGDPHIGGGTNIGKVIAGSQLNSRIVDQINLLDWTLEQAIEHGINNIIITGDIFEEPKPAPQLISIFVSWLKKCHSNDVVVHLIMGNHDVIRSGHNQISSLDLLSEMDLENVHIYKDIDTILLDTTAITLIPFRDRRYFGTSSNEDANKILEESLIYESSLIPVTYTKIAIGHLAIKGSIPVGNEIDDLSNELFCDAQMFKDYDYVWMGHVHNPQVLNQKSPYLAHIGSMDVSNFGETEHNKKIVIFNCVNKKWEYVSLPTRALKKYIITVSKDITDTTQFVLNYLRKHKIIKNSIVKLEIYLESPTLPPCNKKDIEKFLYENGISHLVSILESKKTTQIKKLANINFETDISSAIKSYCASYIDKEYQEICLKESLEIYEQFKMELKE